MAAEGDRHLAGCRAYSDRTAGGRWSTAYLAGTDQASSAHSGGGAWQVDRVMWIAGSGFKPSGFIEWEEEHIVVPSILTKRHVMDFSG